MNTHTHTHTRAHNKHALGDVVGAVGVRVGQGPVEGGVDERVDTLAVAPPGVVDKEQDGLLDRPLPLQQDLAAEEDAVRAFHAERQGEQLGVRRVLVLVSDPQDKPRAVEEGGKVGLGLPAHSQLDGHVAPEHRAVLHLTRGHMTRGEES